MNDHVNDGLSVKRISWNRCRHAFSPDLGENGRTAPNSFSPLRIGMMLFIGT
jgi:hypothetical protein